MIIECMNSKNKVWYQKIAHGSLSAALFFFLTAGPACTTTAGLVLVGF